MKTIGIVADNFKLERFKNELDKGNFIYEVVPFVNDTSTIKVHAHASQVNDIRRICQKVQIHFQQSN